MQSSVWPLKAVRISGWMASSVAVSMDDVGSSITWCGDSSRGIALRSPVSL
jgi:hypothetical protein